MMVRLIDMSKAKQAREIDDIVETVTGQRIPYWLKRGWEKLTENNNRSATQPTVESPYNVLGLDPNCIPADIVSKYRQLAKKYHPDNVETGDEAMFKKITAAYEELCQQRNIR